MNIIFGAIILLFFPLIWLYGLSMMLSGVKTLQIGLRSKRWMAAQALVRNHRVNRYTSGARVERTYYSYVLTCTYAVDEVEYPFMGFWKGGFANQVEAELEVARLYPIGSTVNVFYNPEKHGESVSSKGFDRERQSSFLFSFVFGFALFNVMTALLNGLILQRVFNVSATDASKISQPFYILGTTTLLLAFCCFGFLNIQSAITNNMRGEPRARLRLFIVGCFILALVVPSMIEIGSNIFGLLMIGPKPSSGCYRPDFGQMKWLPTSCPQHVDL